MTLDLPTYPTDGQAEDAKDTPADKKMSTPCEMQEPTTINTTKIARYIVSCFPPIFIEIIPPKTSLKATSYREQVSFLQYRLNLRMDKQAEAMRIGGRRSFRGGGN